MKKCRSIKKQLVAYLHGELDAERQRGVAEHLRQCASCRTALQACRDTLTLLGEALVAAPDPASRRIGGRAASHRQGLPGRGGGIEAWWGTSRMRVALVTGAVCGLLFLFSISIAILHEAPQDTVSRPSGVRVTLHNPARGPQRPGRPRTPPSPAAMPAERLAQGGLSDPVWDPAIPLVRGVLGDLGDMGGMDGFGDVVGQENGFFAAEPFPFMLAKSRPISSFAMAVESVSYGRVRHALEADRLPASDVVRIEELINHFRYNYSHPAGSDLFSVTIEVSQCPWNDAHLLALVGVQGADAGAGVGLAILAEAADIRVAFNPARVEAYRLIGPEPQAMQSVEPSAGSVASGLVAGHAVTALYELVPVGGIEALRTGGGGHEELMRVEFFYRPPQGVEGRLIVRSVPVREIALQEASENLRFAAAVAEFGMLLRDVSRPDAGAYEQVLQQARAAQGNDFEGSRAEFLQLVEKARRLNSSP